MFNVVPYYIRYNSAQNYCYSNRIIIASELRCWNFDRQLNVTFKNRCPTFDPELCPRKSTVIDFLDPDKSVHTVLPCKHYIIKHMHFNYQC